MANQILKWLDRLSGKQSIEQQVEQFAAQAAPFDYQEAIRQAIRSPHFDTAPPPWDKELQIEVKPVNVQLGQLYWRAICGLYLGPGAPAIHLAAVDQNGRIIHPQTTGQAVKFCYDWIGRRPDQKNDPVTGDKPINEPPGVIVLWKNQIVSTWVCGDIPSEKIVNFRSDWADALYHVRFFAAWMLTIKGGEPPPGEPEEPPIDVPLPPADIQALREAVAAMTLRLIRVEGSQDELKAQIRHIKSILREAGE